MTTRSTIITSRNITSHVAFGCLLVAACSGCAARPAIIDLTPEYTALPEIDRLAYFSEIQALPARENGLTGAGVTITVMGERIDPDHPDLSGKITGQYNAFSSPGQLIPGEGADPFLPNGWSYGDGHGTHIAGIIAARCDGVGIQGLACGSTLEAYDLGIYEYDADVYDSDAPDHEYYDDQEAFTHSLAMAFNEITRQGKSRITTGSFNDEVPALPMGVDGYLTSQQIIQLEQAYAQSDDDLAKMLGDPLFDTLPSAATDMLAMADDATHAIAMLYFFVYWPEELMTAIARYQAADGVYLITESNEQFGNHSSIFNALPSLSSAVDAKQWLSVVMVEPADIENHDEYQPSEGAYIAPLNGCGTLAMDYCMVTPSYDILSTMTERVAFSDESLIQIEDRLYQSLGGHSMGAPMIAAALALLEEENRRARLGLSMRELLDILKANANRNFKGYNPVRHGRGMLDIAAALAALQSVKESP